MVGRERELAEIERAVAAVRDGATRVLVLVGEPGIGKSALLAATRERATAAGLQVLAGRAAEHEADVPFGLVVDAFDDRVAALHPPRLASLGDAHLAALAQMLPAAADHAAADAAGERFLLYRAGRALLEMLAGEAPPAVLLDDLQWADTGSLEFVLHLLLRPPATPQLLVIALRPTGPVARLLDAARGAAATVLQLAPLRLDDALDLLAQAGVDNAPGRRMAAEAGGNPLYLQELARVSDAGPHARLPRTLVAAVELEAAALPPASRLLLDGAAVAGDPFELEVAAAAADLGLADAMAPLDRLVAADLVRADDGQRRLRFRHPVVRRAVYDTAPAGWRLGAHERAAAALGARGASAAARALHVEQSARPGDEAAIALLTEAAQSSLASAPATAARWYAAALAMLPAEAGDRRVELLAPLATAQALVGRFDEARASLLEALALPEGQTPWLRPVLTVAVSRLEHITGRHAEATSRLERALAELEPDAAPSTRGQLELQLAAAAVYRGDIDAVAIHADLARAHTGDDAALAVAADAIRAGAAILRADRAVWEVAIDDALAGFRALQDGALADHDEAAWFLGITLVWTSRYRDADEVYTRGLPHASAFGRVALTINSAMNLYNAGRLGRALELVEQAEEQARLMRLDEQLTQAVWMRAQLLTERGDAEAARRAVDDLAAVVARLDAGLIRAMSETVLSILTLDGRPELEAAIVGAVGEELERTEPAWQLHWALQALTRTAIANGRLDRAEHWATLATRRAAELDLPLPAVRSATTRATLALARGEAAEAATLALEAAARADALGAIQPAAEARLVAGPALAEGGDHDAAVRELRRAIDATNAAGCMRLRDHAAQELRRLGERAAPGRPPPGAPDLLTPRERDIAGLVAQGRSNKEVAATVFLSEKTVEKHLSRVYEKLGVRGRAELAAAFRQT